MIIASATPEILSVLDRPNSYIGKVVPRPNLDRLMQGRGLYVSDIELPRMGHVVFLRSPHAHAKIVDIDAAQARRMPGVIAIVTGQELASVITPWVGVSNVYPRWNPNRGEVDRVLEIPLAHFLDPANTTSVVRIQRGLKFSAPCFSWDADRIWGATSMILAELVATLAELSL